MKLGIAVIAFAGLLLLCNIIAFVDERLAEPVEYTQPTIPADNRVYIDFDAAPNALISSCSMYWVCPKCEQEITGLPCKHCEAVEPNELEGWYEEVPIKTIVQHSIGMVEIYHEVPVEYSEVKQDE